MQDNLQRWFALLIAQVLPGLITVFGMSMHVNALKDWLGVAVSRDVTVGGALLIIMLAIACSLVLNGARAIVFEQWLKIDHRDERLLNVDTKRRSDPGTEATYQSFIAQHYAYYQFYGSAFFAVPIVVVLWLTATTASGLTIVVACVSAGAVEYVLYTSAKDSLMRFLKKRADLLPWRDHLSA